MPHPPPSAVPPSTPLAVRMMDRLTAALEPAGDPSKAASMSAYMRDQFPFLGIARPALNALTRQALAGLDRPGEPDLTALALACWLRPEREYQYVACGLLRRHARACGPGFIDTTRHLIVTKSWWDTVDTLAAHLVGPLVRRYPALITTTDAWIAESDRWLVRTALLHQLTFKEHTDPHRLFHYCAAQASHPDFFVRKAIGWALRDYARTDPAAVRAFVTSHQHKLAALTIREALR